jgi:organic radical activating enzyme
MTADLNLYCALAKHGLGINNQGYLTPCCQWYARDADLPELSWQETDRYITEVRHQIVSELADGTPHRGCRHCWHEESLGYKSMRLDWNPRIAEQVDLEELGSKHNHVLDIELCLGNFCNLRCMMCGPFASSQWEVIYKKNQDQAKTWWTLPEQKAAWWEQPGFIEWLTPSLETCLRVNLTGGEPLLIPQTEAIIDKIIELGRADEINLQISSNLTKVSDSILSKLSRFKTVHISVSLEGVGDKNDYVRYPAKWSDIVDNIQRVRQQGSSGIRIGVNHTFQHASAYSFAELAEWCWQNRLDLHLTSVHGHRQLTMPGVPPIDLEKLIKWAETANWLGTPGWPNLIKQYVLGLKDTEFDADIYRQFREYAAFIDATNGTSWDETFRPSDPFA